MNLRISPWKNPANLLIFDKPHWEGFGEAKFVHEALKRYIPDTVAVSAHCLLAPHLAFRAKLYQYPQLKDAKYIALYKGNSWPMSEEEYKKRIAELVQNPENELLYDKYDLKIIKIK